jgi:2-oxoisovalerate dehydrogenase E2 component (dihydrolipoyl transacylase)
MAQEQRHDAPRAPSEEIALAKVTMPQLGESVAEGTIGKWLKKPGDHVAKYEPLLEVITDKVNAEVPSPFEGTLTEILAEEGATVPNNAEIAIIDEVGGSSAGSAPRPASATAPAAVASTAAVPSAAAPSGAAQAAVAPGSAGNGHAATIAVGDADARMTPAVRRLLREHGLSAAQIVGTGGGGRITREDVLDFVESVRTGQPTGQPVGGQAAVGRPADSTAPVPAAVVFPAGADEVLVPMTQMRKGIAAQMTRALAVPHAYVHLEVDVTNLVRLREASKSGYLAREGIGLSYVPFVVKACVEALRRHPTFNAHWTDAGLLAKRRVNVGVAVAVDDGLIVPVIRDVDQLSVGGLNRAIADVAGRARSNKLRVDDFGGGTFTVDNTGYLGSNLTMPIINVPEVAILTMEAIVKRPVVLETPGGDVIAIRSMMNVVLAIDHRANDGAGAAAFLRDVKAWLEAVGPETAIN